LFQYSTLTHLPSKHTKVVWSISTTTPLFGLKFLLIFVVCIIIFSILLPFNVILLFTRTLSQFKFITTFKPLLDAYFAPYKDKAFYWTGLLLLIRIIILAFSAFTKDVKLTAISILLGGLLWWHGVIKPFRNKFENIQESLLVLILMVVHVISLYKIDNSDLTKLVQIIIGSTVVYFALIIIFYCFLYRFKSKIQISAKKVYGVLCKIKELLSRDQNSIGMETLRSNVTHNYQEFQEPLVEFDE